MYRCVGEKTDQAWNRIVSKLDACFASNEAYKADGCTIPASV